MCSRTENMSHNCRSCKHGSHAALCYQPGKREVVPQCHAKSNMLSFPSGIEHSIEDRYILRYCITVSYFQHRDKYFIDQTTNQLNNNVERPSLPESIEIPIIPSPSAKKY